jgi:hypothetical protein
VPFLDQSTLITSVFYTFHLCFQMDICNSQTKFLMELLNIWQQPSGKNFLYRYKFSLKKKRLSTNDATVCWSILFQKGTRILYNVLVMHCFLGFFKNSFGYVSVEPGPDVKSSYWSLVGAKSSMSLLIYSSWFSGKKSIKNKWENRITV